MNQPPPLSETAEDNKLRENILETLDRVRSLAPALTSELRGIVEDPYLTTSPRALQPLLHPLNALVKLTDLEKRAIPASQISVLQQCALDIEKYMQYFKDWGTAYHFFYQTHGESLPQSFTEDDQQEFIKIVQFLFPETWFPGPIEGKRTGNVNDGFTVTLTSYPERQPERGGIPATQIPQSYTIFIPPKNIGKTLSRYFERIVEIQKPLCDRLMQNEAMIKGTELMALSDALREASSRMDTLTKMMYRYPLTHLNTNINLLDLTAAIDNILAQMRSIIQPSDQWPKT